MKNAMCFVALTLILASALPTRAAQSTVGVNGTAALPDNPYGTIGATPAVNSGLDLSGAATVQISAIGCEDYGGGNCNPPNAFTFVAEFVDAAGDPLVLPAGFPDKLSDATPIANQTLFNPIPPVLPWPSVIEPNTLFTGNVLPVPAGAVGILFGFFDSDYGDNAGVMTVTTYSTSANSAPNVSAAAPSTASIWPPNHQMVPITINGVTDPDGDAVTITITGISNNETGAADASGIGTSTAQVRAARNGKGNGRTYTISFTATDGKGGTASGSVSVVVPHDQGGEVADDDHDDDLGDDHGDDHGKVEKKEDDQGKKGDRKVEKKEDDQDKKGDSKVEKKDDDKKDDDKNKKTVAKAPAKRAKPTAVENATWGEVKNSEQ